MIGTRRGISELFVRIGKLSPEATHKKFLSVQQAGAWQVCCKLDYYNMDVIIGENKLHYAATGLTAAELIQSRADHTQPNMGLTSWKAGEVRKTDVTIAKNYLNENEIDELNRIVVMWLDFAEDQARRRKQVFMKDWELKLDEFLAFNERRVLPDAGSVSKKAADAHARYEYVSFALQRREYKETSGEAESIKSLKEAERIGGRSDLEE
jgi:hypothetical protein